MQNASQALDARSLARLKWRCRRGLLENDLFIERFFARHEASLTVGQARGLEALMDLADHDLLNLLLGRERAEGELAIDEVQNVLALMRMPESADRSFAAIDDQLPLPRNHHDHV